MATLYVNNLNEKVSLNRLQRVLTGIFARYGEVHVSAHKNLRMKGQAFVTFKKLKHAEMALEKVNGKLLYRKPMQVSHAKTPSDEAHRIAGDLESIEKRKAAKQQREVNKQPEPKPTLLPKGKMRQFKALPPNSVLLLQSIPQEYLDATTLESHFSKFAGFDKVRLIKFRSLAFVDFENEYNATKCLKEDFPFEGAILTYAKK